MVSPAEDWPEAEGWRESRVASAEAASREAAGSPAWPGGSAEAVSEGSGPDWVAGSRVVDSRGRRGESQERPGLPGPRAGS